ncbi:MAG: quinone-dependent dihydroorotate dehydrogenase [Moraxellaceae bacterium]|nr:quinone-dependent dihydroorotate dehydrogenase [Moraxellaceae bacterium]MDZ4387223.1 quinone-dependent dihydroorotate dehydrogenase [Moraxellaceae bacterium]
MWYPLVRSALFRIDPERAHHLTLDSLAWAERLGLLRHWPKVPEQPIEMLGLKFRNPVGLSAGLDKNGDYIDALAALGFGFIEIGTTTPRPQPGNPKPRIFRIPQAGAVINRLGFNNEGVDHLVRNVERARYDGVLGINIGKNFDTPVEHAADDYVYCLDRVYDHADYITVNISSPNTQGLRSLQGEEALTRLLAALKERQAQLATQHGRYVPFLVKIAPDLTLEEVDGMAKVFKALAIDGVIATNTTIARDAVVGMPNGDEVGGLSGRPVREASTRVIKALSEALDGTMPIIGVGGISDAASAAEKIHAGASLVQLYTGFIFEGPPVIGAAAHGVAQAYAERAK